MNVKWIYPSVETQGSREPMHLHQLAKIQFDFPHFPLLKFSLKDKNMGITLTSTSDGGFDQGVQLLITADGQLQVPRRDPLHFEILGGVPGQLQHLQDSGRRWGCRGQGGWGWGRGGPTSAVRYSRMAALYTAAVAPTRPWLVVRVFRCLWMRPTGNWGAINNLVSTYRPPRVYIDTLHC